jgi:hypothetical protein
MADIQILAAIPGELTTGSGGVEGEAMAANGGVLVLTGMLQARITSINPIKGKISFRFILVSIIFICKAYQ